MAAITEGEGWTKPTLWTAAAAGAHCVTTGWPNGVPGATYRQYVKLLGAPNAVDRDLETGAKLYDPAAVKVWHANRAGQGARTDLKNKA